MVGWVKKFPQLDPTKSLHIFNLGSLVGKKLSQQSSGLRFEPQQLAVCQYSLYPISILNGRFNLTDWEYGVLPKSGQGMITPKQKKHTSHPPIHFFFTKKKLLNISHKIVIENFSYGKSRGKGPKLHVGPWALSEGINRSEKKPLMMRHTQIETCKWGKRVVVRGSTSSSDL